MTEHDIWEDLHSAVCIFCGRVTSVHGHDELPICEKCMENDPEASD